MSGIAALCWLFSLSGICIDDTSKKAAKQRIFQFENGTRVYEVIFHDNRRRLATLRSFSRTGQRLSEEHYLNFTAGIKQGQTRYWYENGQLRLACDYKKATVNGPLAVYYPDGTLKRREYYRQGQLKNGQCFAPDGSVTPCLPLIRKAEFNGGKEKLVDYLRKQLLHLNVDLVNSPAFISLLATVEEDGTVSKLTPTLEAAFRPKPEQELIQRFVDALNYMPTWQPAVLDDMPIAATMLISVLLRDNKVHRVEYEINSFQKNIP